MKFPGSQVQNWSCIKINAWCLDDMDTMRNIHLPVQQLNYCVCLYRPVRSANTPPMIAGDARIDASLGALVQYSFNVTETDTNDAITVTLVPLENTVAPVDFNITTIRIGGCSLLYLRCTLTMFNGHICHSYFFTLNSTACS